MSTASEIHRWTLPTALLLLGIGSAASLACSGSKAPEPLPPQVVAQTAPEPAPPLPPPAPPPIREIEPTRRSTVKVIDAGGQQDQPDSLAEASRRAKAQKAQQRESIAKITDENLHEYSKDAEFIVLESAPAAPSPELEPEPDEEANIGEGDERNKLRGEDYWRTRALELRMGWRRTVDRIQELELEAAALRQQFYAEEDPYLRDSQLKPSWDRVLDRIEQLRDRAARYEQELDVFIEEGQQAGALQGWLNQGWELEPTPEERERSQIGSHQAVDPPTSDEDG